MKDVLVHLTPRAIGRLEHGASYAISLAASHNAHVTGFLSDVEPCSATAPSPPETMQGERASPEPIKTAKCLERAAILLCQTARQAGASCEALTDAGNPASAGTRLANHARLRDLVAVSVYGPLHYPRKSLVEAVLFGTGRPVILIPPGATAFDLNVAVVAWDATASAVRALHASMPLLSVAPNVVVVTVVDDKATDPEPSGDELCHYLERRGINARYEEVRRGTTEIGQVLLNVASRAKADLLVMGGFAHAREREFLFGSATRSVFESGFSQPVLLSH
jgi:nucleotide-binding universal stress UspA family protein